MKDAFLEFTLYPDTPVVVQGTESLFTFQNIGTVTTTLQGSNDSSTWFDIAVLPVGSVQILEHSYKYMRTSHAALSVNRGEGNNAIDSVYTKTQTDSLIQGIQQNLQDTLQTKQDNLNAPDNANKILNGELQWVDMPSGGSGGGGAVDSVNGKTGDVTLDANDVDAYSKSESDNLLSDKVDKEVGKGLSSNDYTNTDKTKVSLIDASGVGDKYLSDDGSYKTVSGGGGGVSEVDVKGWITKNIAINNAYGTGVTSPSATHLGSISIGENSSSQGNTSIQIGVNTQANSGSISVGGNAKSAALYSVAIGMNATVTANNHYAISIGRDSISQHSSVAIGYKASNYVSTHTNCVLLGSNTEVTSANQVQLGDSTTTTYAYGAVQDRSDIRDKTDIQDCTLGLDFINALRPVKYKWDYREDYARDLFPLLNREDYESDEAYQSALEQQQNDREEFFQNPVKDGSKTRSREHHGLIAQEFKQVLDNLGVDHAAYQDHAVNGGMDVKSIGYAELIPNLIKAIQELTLRIEAIENA